MFVCISLAGGRGDDAKKHLHAKSYVSPWEKAMKGDENLIATLKTSMPGPIMQKDNPKWKSFNRYPPFTAGLQNCNVPNRGSDKPSHLPGAQYPMVASRRPNSS